MNIFGNKQTNKKLIKLISNENRQTNKQTFWGKVNILRGKKEKKGEVKKK